MFDKYVYNHFNIHKNLNGRSIEKFEWEMNFLPFCEWLSRIVQHFFPRFAPIYTLRDFAPKSFRILQRFFISFIVFRTGNVMRIDDVIYKKKDSKIFQFISDRETKFSRRISVNIHIDKINSHT